MKEIDLLYRGEAPQAFEHIIEEAVVVNKTSRKRRKHGEHNKPKWTKRTYPAPGRAGDREEETISMYLKKADTVIDISIKSPLK